MSKLYSLLFFVFIKNYFWELPPEYIKIMTGGRSFSDTLKKTNKKNKYTSKNIYFEEFSKRIYDSRQEDKNKIIWRMDLRLFLHSWGC
jgi:hypothetical protein